MGRDDDGTQEMANAYAACTADASLEIQSLARDKREEDCKKGKIQFCNSVLWIASEGEAIILDCQLKGMVSSSILTQF